MKIPPILLGAIIIGLAVQATGCEKEELPGAKPKQEENTTKQNKDKVPDNCPGCGMG